MRPESIDIRKRTAVAVNIRSGSHFKVIQRHGPQLAVLVAFNVNDPTEFFSPGNTRVSLAMGPHRREASTGAIPHWVTSGDMLVSNRWRPMLTMTEDTYGRHDMIFDPCDTHLNVQLLGQEQGCPGCHELHAAALKAYGFETGTVPAGVNLFQNSRYTESGIEIRPTDAQVGDRVGFTAQMDLLVSVSSCPCPLGENRSVCLEIAA